MAVSDIEEYKNSASHSDTDKINYLYGKLQIVLNYLANMRQTVADETVTLDALMDANGNNSEEHHAKTMVFYGRKLANRDLFNGVKNTDMSHIQPPEVGIFTGLDAIISQNDIGRISVTWDCTTGMTNMYKSGEAPSTTSLTQSHMLGSVITMPTIQNLDNGGTGAGTNTYKLKNGYIINGWKINHTGGNVYLYDDLGNNYQDKLINGTLQHVKDVRIFGFSTSFYKLPFKQSILPHYPTPSLTFILDVISEWFNIDFVVRHGTVNPSAPCTVPISTQLGKTINMPLTSLITMDAGYEIDKTGSPYGQWTTVDPDTGTSQIDPSGDPLPDVIYDAGSSYNVGTDVDAGVRHLYLKIITPA